MLGCVVLISDSSSETLRSPLHTALMIRRRTGVDSRPNNSAALSNTRS
jgi:hypothetical protein